MSLLSYSSASPGHFRRIHFIVLLQKLVNYQSACRMHKIVFLLCKAPNFELSCLSLPKFNQKSHDPFIILTKNGSFVLLASSVRFGMKFANVSFRIKRARTKIPRKFVAKRFRLEFNVFNGSREHYHTHRLFIPLVFKKSNKSFIEYSNMTSGVAAMHFSWPDFANARARYFSVQAVTSRSDCWIDNTLL